MRERAAIWPLQLQQLGVMVDSGLPIEKALNALNRSVHKGDAKKDNPKLLKAQRLVNRGTSLSEAFRRVGLVNDFDYTMLSTADAAGKISDGLNHISERRIDQLLRVGSFKASLILPKALILIGALAGVFIRTTSGQQSVTEASFAVGASVLWFYLLTCFAVFIVSADTRIWISWFWPYRIVRKRVHWYRQAVEYFFYNSLLWQISAGVTASAATEGCSKLLRSKPFQQSVMSASVSMDRGVSLHQALVNEGLVLTDRLRQVLLIADRSGTHEAAIRHELGLQRSSLKQKMENFFKWAPRVFYVLALVFVSKMMATY